MDAGRRLQILDAACRLGPEPFNRLVETVEDTRKRGRLRFWPEEMFGAMPGVGPVGHEDCLAAFEGSSPRPVTVVPEEQPTPDLHHPRLGGMNRDDRGWAGAARLPRFAAPGTALWREDDPPEGYVRVFVEELDPVGAAAEQEAAVDRLLDREGVVFAAVWGRLTEALSGYDLGTQVICTGVAVSRWHADGAAYLGFSFDCDGRLEHGLQVVYHPTKGRWWGDWEALNAIEEADNLPRRKGDEGAE